MLADILSRYRWVALLQALAGVARLQGPQGANRIASALGA